MLIALTLPISATARTVAPEEDLLRAGEGEAAPLYGSAYFDPLRDIYRPFYFVSAPGDGWTLDPLFPAFNRRPDAGAGGVIIGPSGYYKIVLEKMDGAAAARHASGGGASSPPPPVASRRAGRPGSSFGGATPLAAAGGSSFATPGGGDTLVTDEELTEIVTRTPDTPDATGGSGQTPAVPLPPAAALLLTALAGLCLRRRG